MTLIGSWGSHSPKPLPGLDPRGTFSLAYGWETEAEKEARIRREIEAKGFQNGEHSASAHRFGPGLPVEPLSGVAARFMPDWGEKQSAHTLRAVEPASAIGIRHPRGLVAQGRPRRVHIPRN